MALITPRFSRDDGQLEKITYGSRNAMGVSLVKKTQPRVLVLSYSHLHRDGRVLRQIRFLLGVSDVELLVAAHGKCPIQDPRVRFIALPRNRTPVNKLIAGARLLSRRYRNYDPAFGGQSELYRRLNDESFDLIVANDADTLQAAFALKRPSTRVLFDAHEFSPRQFDDQWVFRVFSMPYLTRMLDLYIREVDAMVTVSPGLVAAYSQQFGVTAEVILNAPFFSDLDPSPVSPERVDMVHHGAITASRNLIGMFELMEQLDSRFHLWLMLIRNDAVIYEKIQRAAMALPRVHLLDPVQPEHIAETINRFDIGLYMMPPANFNSIHALPNKVFEFIQARLALAVWPTPEMARLVTEHGVGIVAKSFSTQALAQQLNMLAPNDIADYKLASQRAADQLSANHYGDRFREIVKSLLS